MKYIERFFSGLGLAIILIAVWYVFIGGNDNLQYYYNINIVDEFFAAAVAVGIAVVAGIVAVGIAVGIVAVGIATVGIAGVNLSIDLGITFFIIFLVFCLVNIYIINQIENKKFDKSYWVIHAMLVATFVIAIYFTPLVVEYKASNKIEALELELEAVIKVDLTGQISIPVESITEGNELTKFLYLESAQPDSIGQLLFPLTEFAVLGFSSKDTSCYDLVFHKDSSAVALWLRSYNKKKKIMDF